MAKTDLNILDRPSPNFGPRRGGVRPDMVVLHYTAMTSCEAAAERLCDPAYEVSAHYLIGEDGRVLRLVAEDQRAWHAGAGQWGDVTDVNSRSIGIELANTGRTPFAAAQMDALEILLGGLLPRWGIRPERVIGHSDMAPERKADPGARFDWARLVIRGLAVAAPRSDAGPLEPLAEAGHAALKDALTKIGYGAALSEAAALTAFRLRFRQGARGPANEGDLAAAKWLAEHFPVDRTSAKA